TFFDCRRNDPSAKRLGEKQAVARLRTLISENALRVNHPGDRISEFRFLIADAVAAHHRASRLNHLGQAAGKNALQNVEIAFIGKADESERAQRLSTHGIDVA